MQVSEYNARLQPQTIMSDLHVILLQGLSTQHKAVSAQQEPGNNSKRDCSFIGKSTQHCQLFSWVTTYTWDKSCMASSRIPNTALHGTKLRYIKHKGHPRHQNAEINSRSIFFKMPWSYPHMYVFLFYIHMTCKCIFILQIASVRNKQHGMSMYEWVPFIGVCI